MHDPWHNVDMAYANRAPILGSFDYDYWIAAFDAHVTDWQLEQYRIAQYHEDWQNDAAYQGRFATDDYYQDWD